MNDTNPDYSEHIAKEIDSEINLLIQTAHKKATKILVKEKQSLVKISTILLEKEVIEGEEFLALFKKYKTASKASQSVKKNTLKKAEDSVKKTS